MSSAVSAHPPGGLHSEPELTSTQARQTPAFAAGYSAVYQAMVVVLAGIILYAFIRARREHLGQIPAPTDLTGAAGGRPPASQHSLTAIPGENSAEAVAAPGA